MDRAEIERASRTVLEEAPGLVCAYLFGSVARDPSGAGRDVDLAVLYRDGAPKTLVERFELEGRLEGALRRPVQVTVLDGAPPDLVHRVLRDGRLLLDRDPSRRVRFEVEARGAYLDLLPILLRYRRAEATP